jgi:hypothetical protein
MSRRSGSRRRSSGSRSTRIAPARIATGSARRWTLAATLALAAAVPGCTQTEWARDTLEEAGFTEIDVGGWRPWSCGDGETFATAFAATNAAGDRVEGVVCCASRASCTVRF